MNATYISTARPLTYGAYPDRPSDPKPVFIDQVKLPAPTILLPSGQLALDFGRITYGGRLDFERIDHFSLLPQDETELAQFILWRYFDHRPDDFINDFVRLNETDQALVFEQHGVVIRWALKKVLTR